MSTSGKATTTYGPRCFTHRGPIDWGKAMSPCEIWQGRLDRDGYAIQNHRTAAHSGRVARDRYITAHGPIGSLVIDHLCRVRACVNVDHLEAVTNRENVMRGRKPNGEKTHCPQGHEYRGDNVYYGTQGKYGTIVRHCRVCDREQHNRRYADARRS